MKLKAYVINLDRRTDRWQKMQEVWSSFFELRRFSAFDTPENGQMGCRKSHVVLAHSVLGSDDVVIVLEDDARPTEWFSKIGAACLEEAIRHSDKWDYVNCGALLDLSEASTARLATLKPTSSKLFLQTDYSQNTSFVIYNKKSLRLLDDSLKSEKAIDVFLGDRSLCQWVPIRLISDQSEDYSDIRHLTQHSSLLYEKSAKLLEQFPL